MGPLPPVRLVVVAEVEKIRSECPLRIGLPTSKLRVFPVLVFFFLAIALFGCSASSNTNSDPPPPADPSSPSAPGSLVATATSNTQITLTWSASTDNVGVSGYRIERCSGANCGSFAQIATTASGMTTYSDTGLTASTSYSYRVRATDAAGNLGAYSNVASATTLASADTTAPTAPTNLAATASSNTQVGLTWAASTDNVGVTGYRVERCAGASCSSFTQIGTTTGVTSYTDSSLTASTSYSYRVRATDAAGNLSAYSNVAPATTLAAADTTPPTAPTSLAATASSSSQIGLTWTASTDNVGVTGYRIERCSGASCSSFAQIGTTTGATSYSDTGLTAATSYSYRVRATDAAGNLSGYSNVATASTPASGGSSITISVSPKRGGLTVSQTLSLIATLTNDTGNQGANWSFTSTGSTTGGGFSASNTTSGTQVVFTAPSGPGVVTITATAVGDGTKTATATIGVTNLTGVATYLNGNSRQGGNTEEYALTTSGVTAVNTSNFGKLFSCSVDAAIYPQPLWVANLSVSGKNHNVVFVATEHDTVYAFDADSNSSPCTPLWTASLLDTAHGGASGESWVTSSDDGCGDLVPDVGIVGTPVIDLSSKTMFVVSKTKNSGNFFQRLHALDITTGDEKFSGPTAISATVSGTGVGSSGGNVSFDPLVNNQRPALLLVNGHVIITWASHCDAGAYHGWVISYSASTLAREAVLNTSPNGINAGIWMSGSAPAADSSGNIYLATGNGTFNANTSGGKDYGDAVMKLSPPSGGTFAVASYFRPFTIVSPDDADTDQGSGGVMVLPAVGSKNYLVQGGKDGNAYVMDSASLGGYNSSSNNMIQELNGGLSGGMWASPTYFNGSVYFGPSFGRSMRAFSFDTVSSATLSSSPSSVTSFSFSFPGPTASISSNGSSNGIVWALDNQAYCTEQSSTCGPAVLRAYDATNLATLLWNSTQGSGNAAGNAVKFAVPTVANGKVYVGTRGNNAGGSASSTSVPGELDVYGLLPN